jgi:hypothetical protein
MIQRTCLDCGCDISHRHRNAKRCEACGAERSRQVTGQGTRSRPCSVDDGECIPGRLRYGMCERHYRRVKATGSPAPAVAPTFKRYTVTDTGCREWAGGLYPNGYGKLGAEINGTTLAHIAFYVEACGPVPDGLELDHLCRNRACVNPDHLEPVTRSVNIQRGVAARLAERGGRCVHGHDLTEPDAWHVERSGARYCKECWRIKYRAASARYRAKRKS